MGWQTEAKCERSVNTERRTAIPTDGDSGDSRAFLKKPDQAAECSQCGRIESPNPKVSGSHRKTSKNGGQTAAPSPES
ncbi:MAG: hypothetical protein DWQ34_05470 [Planctomycetota bacterium]|nr:MAG: hypothetical protein DWQ29_20595 [Planctomycetota bacterium]REJ95729.1 MAG: hypothetical protein DWQ34_05470 [Planctomycetota bacterium]REK23399.1 MAG: hypothetical protein DWQ41_16720 [Planctomycetota bacterium]REK38964.1 MAG: hypothetical protein DWQ45_03750 [Planctomycetota bacterium]